MLSDVLESHRMFAIAMRRPGTRREVFPCRWPALALCGFVWVCVGLCGFVWARATAHRTFCSLA
jgi:hypothetical protein